MKMNLNKLAALSVLSLLLGPSICLAQTHLSHANLSKTNGPTTDAAKVKALVEAFSEALVAKDQVRAAQMLVTFDDGTGTHQKAIDPERPFAQWPAAHGASHALKSESIQRIGYYRSNENLIYLVETKRAFSPNEWFKEPHLYVVVHDKGQQLKILDATCLNGRLIENYAEGFTESDLAKRLTEAKLLNLR